MTEGRERAMVGGNPEFSWGPYEYNEERPSVQFLFLHNQPTKNQREQLEWKIVIVTWEEKGIEREREKEDLSPLPPHSRIKPIKACQHNEGHKRHGETGEYPVI